MALYAVPPFIQFSISFVLLQPLRVAVEIKTSVTLGVAAVMALIGLVQASAAPCTFLVHPGDKQT